MVEIDLNMIQENIFSKLEKCWSSEKGHVDRYISSCID